MDKMSPSAVIVGAGPVGCLAALGLVQRGYHVTIYEGRSRDTFVPVQADASDGSTSSSSSRQGASWARSINLALSERGLTALHSVDPELAQRVLQEAVPMRGRMIHAEPKEKAARTRAEQAQRRVHLDSQAYSIKGKCINSVSRTLLSQLLLKEVEQSAGVELRWSHRLRHVSFHKGAEKGQDLTVAKLSFQSSAHADLIEVTTDAVFGCDGHHSKLRAAMQSEGTITVEESNIDPLYLELHIPAGRDAQTGKATYAIDPHHLHIWPRRDFMLIALPNRDKSFTATLFAPQQIIEQHLQTPKAAHAFFAEHFSDALDVAGPDYMVEQLLHAKSSPLGMVQCSAYHRDGAALLLGDAAHAMVPFYGQGLNCGLEDVRIMLDALDQQMSRRISSVLQIEEGKEESMRQARTAAFAQYTRERHDDLLAICRLALDNYNEMSNKVIRPDYLLRKRLDNLLERYLPQSWWASLYTLVTFSNVGYASARKQEARQARIVEAGVYSALAAMAAGLSFAGIKACSYLRRARG